MTEFFKMSVSSSGREEGVNTPTGLNRQSVKLTTRRHNPDHRPDVKLDRMREDNTSLDRLRHVDISARQEADDVRTRDRGTTAADLASSTMLRNPAQAGRPAVSGGCLDTAERVLGALRPADVIDA